MHFRNSFKIILMFKNIKFRIKDKSINKTKLQQFSSDVAPTGLFLLIFAFLQRFRP